MMVMHKMANNITLAETLIQQGHVKIGPDVVRNPSFLVTRKVEDYLTWDDESKMKRKVEEFRGFEDDYDLGGKD